MLRTLLFILYVKKSSGYASKMCAAYCGTSLTLGTYIMGHPAASSSAHSVAVFRNGVAINSGYRFLVGDNAIYTVSLTSDSGIEWAMQISGATFSYGSCQSIRIFQGTPNKAIKLPASASAGTEVKIWAGYASGKSTVYITPAFLLVAKAAVPSAISTVTPSAIGSTIPQTTFPSSSKPTSQSAEFAPSSSSLSRSYTCSLTADLSISWSITQSSVDCTLTLLGSKSKWLSAGVVDNMETKMVSSSAIPNTVFLYQPNNAVAGTFQLRGESSEMTVEDTKHRTLSRLTYVSTNSKGSTMSFKLSTKKEFATDTSVDLEDGNKLIWAHGGIWPESHPTGSYGFSNIYWSSGSCKPLAKSVTVSPYVVFVLLALVSIFSSAFSPFRNWRVVHYLHVRKVPLAFWGFNEVSISGLLFICLYLTLNVIVFAVGLPEAPLLWGQINKATAKVAIMNFWMALIPASKNAITLKLFGVPFERAVKYHKMVTPLGLTWAILHLISNVMSNPDIVLSKEPAGEYKVIPVYGFVAFVIFCSMAIMAFEPIRRAHHELFLTAHRVVWLAVLFLFLHVRLMALGFIPGMLLHAWDIANRLYSLYTATNPVICQVISKFSGLPSSTIKDTDHILHLIVPDSRISDAKMGQYYFINVSSISLTEWHPFTIAQADRENKMVHFFIKSVGGTKSWTNQLALASFSMPSAIKVALDGPYGELSLEIFRYHGVTLVAGGIGITPMLNIMESRKILPSNGLHKLLCMRLVWVVRDVGLVYCLSDRLSALMGDVELPSITPKESTQTESDVNLRNCSSQSIFDMKIDIFLTQEKGVQSSSVNRALMHRGITFHRGRPSVLTALAETIKASSIAMNGILANTCALVCGPASLSQDVLRAGASLSIDVHTEKFHL